MQRSVKRKSFSNAPKAKNEMEREFAYVCYSCNGPTLHAPAFQGREQRITILEIETIVP